jgi:uncharacterized protein YcaQ
MILRMNARQTDPSSATLGTALSTTQARHLQLAAQGLLTPPSRAAIPQVLRSCIAQMQLLQIDTISWWGWKDEKRWLETLFATP